MSIAVTAASGRLGHAVLRHLQNETGARRLVAVARDPRRVDVPGVETRVGDYGLPDSMRAAFHGVRTVIMISAPVAAGVERIPLHRNVIAAARQAGVERVLYTSVIGNGREMHTLFGPTQQVNRQTETDLQESGLRWLVGRNGLYLDLDLIQIRNAAAAGVYTNAAGDGRCPYLSIDEIAYAHARMAITDSLSGRTLNIVGAALTQHEIVELANQVLGLDVRYQAISDDACIRKFASLMPGRGDAVARMLTGCFQGIRCGAFDVPSDFAEATGRPARSIRRMMEAIAAGSGAG